MRIYKTAGVASALLFVACSPSDMGASGALSGLAVFAGITALAGLGARRDARAGAPMPCDGYEETACDGERIVTHCCPKGAKCNFRDGPHVTCGHGLCRAGGDISRCAAPVATTTPAKSEADCKKDHGSWELVCADKVVVAACLPPMPTNFMGPGYKPAFTMCGKGDRLVSTAVVVGERCTNHRLAEDCYPTASEGKCLGAVTKVCLGGKVVDKCLPVSLQPRAWEAAAFVKCPDGSCAIGTDSANACRF